LSNDGRPYLLTILVGASSRVGLLYAILIF
jgi:hypothetical protein